MTRFAEVFKKVKNKLYVHQQLKREKTLHTSKCDLKFIFIPEIKSDHLLVVFSGFPPLNQSARYNYMVTLKNIKCNKLFILDDFGTDREVLTI